MNNDAYNNLSNRQRMYVDAIREHAEANSIDATKTDFSRAELRLVSMATKGKVWIPNWITHDRSRRAARGVFHIPEVPLEVVATVPTDSSDTAPIEELVAV